MKAGDIIYSVLTGTSAVTAITSTRIYPVDVPLDVDLPCVWYDVALADSIDGSAAMQPLQVQVGCLAHTEAVAHSLASVAHGALNGVTRNSSGTWIRHLSLLNRTESRDEEANVWGVLLTYGGHVTY